MCRVMTSSRSFSGENSLDRDVSGLCLLKPARVCGLCQDSATTRR